MKIRFGSKAYPIVDGGAGEYDNQASFQIVQGSVAFSTIENAIKAGISDITLLSDSNEEIQSFTGYDTIESIRKVYNYEAGGVTYPDVIMVEIYRSQVDVMQDLIDKVDTIPEGIEDDITALQEALVEVYEMMTGGENG